VGRTASRRLAALAAALLPLAPAPARASGPAFGAGAAGVSVSSDALQGGGGGGAGLLVYGSYRFSDRLSLELAVTGVAEHLPTRATTDISYPEDRAEASVLDLRLRLDLVPSSQARLVPWVGLGLGLVTLNWQEYFYMEQGIGLSLAAGLDVRLHRGSFLRASLTHVRAGTGDNYGHDTPPASATALALSAGWQFGWAPLPPEPPGPPEPDASAPAEGASARGPHH
jgi:hypothetical protein